MRPDDAHDARVKISGWLLALAMCVLGVAGFAVVSSLSGGSTGVTLESVLSSLPALLVYMLLPRVVDRYAPEPVWVLALSAFMGAIASGGMAVALNELCANLLVSAGGWSDAEAVLIVTRWMAPFTEELTKAAPLVWLYFFARHEFDGVADAVLSAVFVGLGFAFAENLALSAWSAHHGGGEPGLARVLLMPWAHPLFAACTGIGFGLARERAGRARWLAPLLGYVCASLCHLLWNALHTNVSVGTGLSLSMWGLFVGALSAVTYALVQRKGRIVSAYLKDEVLYGTITQDEFDLVSARFGRVTARLRFGAPGVRFVDAAAKLALCKWHTTRARHARQGTLSAHLIVPLRDEIGVQRTAIGERLGKTMPLPSRWVPTPKSGETPTRYG